MATASEAEVRVIIDNLKELVARNSDLIPADGHLSADLEKLKITIKDQAERQNNIRELALEAEDAIETFLVEGRTTGKLAHKAEYKSELRRLHKKIEEIRDKTNEIYKNYGQYGLESLNSQGTTSIIRARAKKTELMDEYMVGRQEEVEMIVDRLISGTEKLEVISITGMLGMGKTTVARRVFNDPSIEYQFMLRVFVSVSQEYERKKVFLSILGALSPVTDQMFEMPDTELAELIHKSLEKRPFFIVMDDVWTTEAWNDLKVAFPLENQRRSRVLITTENSTVATNASRIRNTHKLRFLHDYESRELLRRRVFGADSIPAELEDLESMILKKCSGLPLAIVVVAGTLSQNRSKAYWWERVAAGGIGNEGSPMKEVIRLSFNQLPQHLKLCFLYFGVFRKDTVIPARTLLQLWMAEGLIREDRRKCLEDVAAEYLDELVDRNLVMVEKKRSDGRVKDCVIHDALHEFCKEEGKKENLFQDAGLNSPLDDCRRICINSNIGEFLTSMPNGKRVRSLLSFSKEDFVCPRESASSIPKAFKLLRLLDVRSIRLTLFPLELCYLFLLRYIAISCDFKILPEELSQLRNLQTLIILTTQRTLLIKACISKMPLLRHLYSNASIYLPRIEGETSSSANENLQTLSTISSESCGKEILQMGPNLKKLGIRGNLSAILDGNLFDQCLSRLEYLENLKLLNDSDSPELQALPQENNFPRKLTSLTLSNTFLEWKHMSRLGKLESLEVLKLRDNAFMGKVWEVEDEGFQRLKVLHIGNTDLMIWRASENHFPLLVSLFLKSCKMLQALPHDFAHLPCLQTIDLYFCNRKLAANARKIMMLKHDLGESFKLLVSPTDL